MSRINIYIFLIYFFWASFFSLETSSKSSTNSGASAVLSAFFLFLIVLAKSLTKSYCLGPNCLRIPGRYSLMLLVSCTPETKLTFSLKEYSKEGLVKWRTVLSSLKMLISLTSLIFLAPDFFDKAWIFLSVSTLLPLCLTSFFLFCVPIFLFYFLPFPPICVFPNFSAIFFLASNISLDVSLSLIFNTIFKWILIFIFYLIFYSFFIFIFFYFYI